MITLLWRKASFISTTLYILKYNTWETIKLNTQAIVQLLKCRSNLTWEQINRDHSLNLNKQFASHYILSMYEWL